MEIVEDFEREIIGRVPRSVPAVIWTITEESKEDAEVVVCGS